MGRSRVLQHSLNGGILSPTAYGRVDLNKYYNSVGDALNVNCHPHGGLWKRKGLKHIAEVQEGRLVKFAFNVSQAYVLVFSLNNIAVYSGETFVQDVTTTYTLAEVTALGYTQSADTMIITHEDHTPRQLLRNSGTGVWSIEDITLTNVTRYDYGGDLYYDYTNTGLAQTIESEIDQRVYNDDDDYGNQWHVYRAKVTQLDDNLDPLDIDLSDEDFQEDFDKEFGSIATYRCRIKRE